MRIKFGVIWPHRLEDFNVLVLKKDANIPKNTFGGEIRLLNLLKWKKCKLQSDSKLAYKHTNEKISFNWFIVSTKLFWNVKKQWKNYQRITSMVEPPFTKMLLIRS